MVTLPDAILDCRSPILDCAARVQIPWSHWAGEKLVLTELEGRFRDACFCCAGWNDVASERSLSPPCEGGNSVRHSFCLLPLPAHPKTSCKSDMFNIYLTCALLAPR